MGKEKLLEKLESILKEEMWGRVSPKDIGLSKFKVLEDFFNNAVSSDSEKEVKEECLEYISSGNKSSVSAKFILGLIAYHKNEIDDKIYLQELVDVFIKYNKWAIVEYLSEKILEYGENRNALKALGYSLEKLKRQKEAVPVWEELIKLNRFDFDISLKLWKNLKEDSTERGVQYLKYAIEGLVRDKQYDKLSDLWPDIVMYTKEDLSFIERIERQLTDAKKIDIVNDLLLQLTDEITDVNPKEAVKILKRVLLNDPQDIPSRKKLVELYKQIYKDHSQFDHFLYVSNLNNYRRPVAEAIKNFENNIVFDVGNYVYHRSWGLGEIQEMDKESISINFEEKQNHSMSIKMALQSLQPVSTDHLYVMQHLDPEKMKEMFAKDFISFFKILVRSYGDSITVANIKADLIPRYIDQKNWSKWWSKARNIIKMDPDLGFSDKKKDLIFLRERPITFADELLKKFSNAVSFSDHLDIAEEYVNNVNPEESVDKHEAFVEYFLEASKSDSNTKLVLSYFVLNDFEKYSEDIVSQIKVLKEKVKEFIKDSEDLLSLSRKISSYDNKKIFLNLVYEIREDWREVYSSILFELPLRIHRYIITRFIQEKCFNEINEFIEKITANSRQYPEIFLWVFKNILAKKWDYNWLDYSEKNLILGFFRVFRQIQKIEQKGNRLKNIASDIIFGDDSAVLKEICEKYDEEFLNKIYDMAMSSDLLDEAQLEKFVAVIKTKYPSYIPREVKLAEDKFDEQKVYVLQSGYNKKAKELSDMVNVEMVKLQKDLSSVSDVTSDIKENFDYTALLEKQSILKQSISMLDAELKQVKIIDPDAVSTDEVNIGTTVELESDDSKEIVRYSILGPWDVDFDNNVLSYRSEIAKKLLNAKLDDSVEIDVGNGIKSFKIKKIENYKA